MNNDSMHGNTGMCPKCGNHIGSEHFAKQGCNDDAIEWNETAKVMKRITGLLTSVMVTSHNLSESLYERKETTDHKTTLLNVCSMLRHVGGEAFAKRTEVFKLMGMVRCLIPEEDSKPSG
jgi:hypothetical protein